MNDLFSGNPIIESSLPARFRGKRKPTIPKGYAAPPGTGPSGETCKTCKHLCRVCFSKVYLKCGLMCRAWTGGPGTDIKAGSPACSKWAPAHNEIEGKGQMKIDGLSGVVVKHDRRGMSPL